MRADAVERCHLLHVQAEHGRVLGGHLTPPVYDVIMPRRIRLGVLVLFIAAGSTAPALADLDCADFGSRAEAQAHLAENPDDPDRLDADNDGKACEPKPGGTPAWLWAIGGSALGAAALAVAQRR